MATKNDGETINCTFQWRIENVTHGWWLREGERIVSPTFIADGLEGTKWSLCLYLMGSMNDNDIVIHLRREKDCSGPDCVDVEYHLAFLGKDGSILEQDKNVECFEIDKDSTSLCLDSQEIVFVTDRETYLPEDTLTVQCTIRKAEKKRGRKDLVKSKHLYARTVLKVIRKSFDWKIAKFSTLQPGVIKKFKGDLIEFSIILNEDSGKKLRTNIISFHDFIKYISCNTSIIDSEGKKESCGIKNYSVGDLKKRVLSSMLIFPTKFLENKNHYLPNDVLSLDFDIVIATVEHSDCRKDSENDAGQEKYENMAVLINDLKSMYNDHILSDTELRTSTKTFLTNKNILSARSLVFRRMFSHDMKEKNIGHVDIDDMEDDIVHRMLLFMYTGLLEDLKFVSASKLYTAADKYEIPSLKIMCSSFLKDNLCPATACDVLLLADLHQDDDLKNAVKVYILEHDEVFRSPEWENFMDSNIKLAADIMYRKINPEKI